MWCRWGHEGDPPKSMMLPVKDRQDGIETFEKKHEARIKAGYKSNTAEDE